MQHKVLLSDAECVSFVPVSTIVRRVRSVGLIAFVMVRFTEIC